MGATSDKIFLALQGFGAGVQGRGQEFIQGLEDNRKKAMVEDSYKIHGALQRQDVPGARRLLAERVDALKQSGGDWSDSQEYIDRLDQGDVPGVMGEMSDAVNWGYANGMLKPTQGASYRQTSSAPIIDPTTGQMSMPVFDPNTGKSRLEPIPGAVQETPGARRMAETQADLETKRGSLQANRGSELRKEISARNREAARSQVRLRRALKLSQTASQGVTGEIKLQLSRLFPGIDVADEAALDTTLNQLAMDELQRFKGPTTDFELGVSQSIVGEIGKSAEANQARLKALDRNSWFMRREYEQLNKYLMDGGNPDKFAFDFYDTVQTKSGTHTLMDLQDTAVANNMTIDEVLAELNK